MEAEWHTITLENAPVEIIDGDRGENYPRQDEFSASGHCLFLNAGNVTSGGFKFSDCAFITTEKDAVLRKGKLARNDVVLTTRGTVGNTAYFDDSVPFDHIRINSGMVILRARQPELDSRYLYLFVRSEVFHSQVAALRTGSAQPQLPIRDIYRIEIPIPPPEEQRAIAHILGTLDDKIELNRRMNETLEAMARAIFKSWFVDFDPVRAKAEGRDPGLPKPLADLFPDSFEDSELGEIPKEWGVGSLFDFASLNPEAWSKDTRPSVINYVDLSNTKWGRIDEVTTYTQQEAPSRAQRVLRPQDTIVGTARPGNGSYALISEDGLTGSTGFAVLRPLRTEYTEFVYLNATAADNIDRLAHLADGAAYPAVRPEVVAATLVLKSPDEVIERFSCVAEPVLAKAASNERESQTIAALRDTLLPKLITGELRVPEAERAVQGVAV
jgi:type I restriction enzyme S subunit